MTRDRPKSVLPEDRDPPRFVLGSVSDPGRRVRGVEQLRSAPNRATEQVFPRAAARAPPLPRGLLSGIWWSPLDSFPVEPGSVPGGADFSRPNLLIRTGVRADFSRPHPESLSPDVRENAKRGTRNPTGATDTRTRWSCPLSFLPLVGEGRGGGESPRSRGCAPSHGRPPHPGPNPVEREISRSQVQGSDPLPPCGGGPGWGDEPRASGAAQSPARAPTPHPHPPPHGGREEDAPESQEGATVFSAFAYPKRCLN
jgi:hypothetical protein